MDLPKRFIERSGVSLTSYERPHIYREPSKAVWTRKKERVTDADVTWMTRPDGDASDPSRINEAISYYSKGINPSVEVSYASHGAGGSATTHIPTSQAGSVYKITNVRPPLFPVETTLPLSRPRTHQTKSVSTNPGLSQAYSTITPAYEIDNAVVNYSINSDALTLPITVQSTYTYKLEQPQVMSAKWAINENRPSGYSILSNPGKSINTDAFLCRETTQYGTVIRPKVEANTNLSLGTMDAMNSDASGKVRESMLLENIKPNFQIIIYDPFNHVSSEVSANMKEKHNIAVRAARGMPIILNREDGTPIKLKDVKWTAVQTNAGLDQVILTIDQPNIELDRNSPLYSIEGNFYAPTDTLMRTNDPYELAGKISTNAFSNPSLGSTGYNEDNTRRLQDMVKTAETLPFSSFENPPNYIPTYSGLSQPPVQVRDNSRNKGANGEYFNRVFG